MNYPRERWLKFFQRDIYTVFSEYFRNVVYHGIKIEAFPDTSQIATAQRQQKGSEQITAPLMVNFKLTNLNSTLDFDVIEYPSVKLMDIPLYSEEGFRSKTTTIIPISMLTYASGWYFEAGSRRDCESQLMFHNKHNRCFCLGSDGKVSTNSAKTIPVAIFLKAVTGLSFDELQVFYQHFPIFLEFIFGIEEPTLEECCYSVMQLLSPGKDCSLGIAVETMSDYLFQSYYGKVGSERVKRYLDMESYHRFHGMTIVECDNSQIPINSVITTELAEKMDTDIKVYECVLENNDGKRYYVKRCYAENFSTSLSGNEILYAYYQYLLFCSGIGSLHDSQELSNLVLEAVDKTAEKCIEWTLNKVVQEIKSNINASMFNPLYKIEEYISGIFTDRDKMNYDIVARMGNIESNRVNDITNTISEMDLSRKIKRENSDSQRDVHRSHYGRLDMNDTPESAEVGLTISLCAHSDIDENGFITVPLYPVSNGIVDTSKTVYLSYLDEKWKYIAPVGADLEKYEMDQLVPDCTLNGVTVSALKKDISYQRRQSEDYYGSTLNTVPGVTWNGIKRYTLASSGFKQACPLLKPERSYLSTGFNKNDAGVIRTEDIISDYLLSIGCFDFEIPKDITMHLISLKNDVNILEARFSLSAPVAGIETVTYNTMGISKSISKTLRNYKIVNSDTTYIYSYGDIVFYSNDVSIESRDTDNVAVAGIVSNEDKKKIVDHDIALGQNLKVLFKTFEGYGYEDSVQLNRRFVNNFGLSTIFTESITDNTKNQDKNVKITYTSKGLRKGTEDLSYIEDDGLPALGTYLKPGDVVISRLFEYVEDNKCVNKPLRVSVNSEGYVWYRNVRLVHEKNISYYSAEVILARILPMDIGDKITGGHGNKATCSRILEEHEMPYFEDGTTPDIIFDPLGCIARENVGQLTECLLAEVGRKENKTIIVNHGVAMSPDNIIKKAEEDSGLHLQTLYNPRTGEPYKEKAFIGTMHIVRSTHTCFSKYNAMGSSKGKTAINFQPTREGAEHAQRISELTTWCYRAAGAEDVLNTLFSLQSDDIEGHNRLIASIHNDEQYDGDYDQSINGYKLQAYLRFFGINMAFEGSNVYLEPINSAKAVELSHNNILYLDGVKYVKVLEDTSKFGEPNPKDLLTNIQKYGAIELPKEIIFPTFLNSKEFTGCIPTLKVLKTSKTGAPIVVFEGLKPSEVKKVLINRTSFFGTLSEPVEVTVNVDKETVNVVMEKCFFYTDYDSKSDEWKDIYKVFNLCNGDSFFDILADETLYSLDICLDIYKNIYLKSQNLMADGDDIEGSIHDIEEAIKDDAVTENEYTYREDNDIIDEDELDEKISSNELSNVLVGYSESCMRLQEFIQNGFSISDYLCKYVMVPPLCLRPTSEHGSYRVFSKVFSNILGCSHEIMEVYSKLASELKQSSKKNSSKTIITELTSHKNKNSVIRDTILAKPVSFSGRSVITVDPSLKLGECKVPIRMLVTIYQEHLLTRVKNDENGLIHHYSCVSKGQGYAFRRDIFKSLINKLVNNSVKGIKAFCPAEKDVDTLKKLFNDLKTELCTYLTDLSEIYPVLLSRDPALWKLSVRGHKFIPSDGYTIRIHPLVCMGFNADFDGDQMSAIFPMHKSAIKTIGEKMMVGTDLINSQEATSVFVFEQDILLGHFYATKDEPNKDRIKDIVHLPVDDGCYYHNEDIEMYDDFRLKCLQSLYDKIEIGTREYSDTVIVRYGNRNYLTTIGRLMFNICYPLSYVFTDEQSNGFYELRFKTIDKKKSKEFTSWILYMQQNYKDKFDAIDDDIIYKNNYGLNGYVMRVAQRLMSFGFYSADMSSTTISYWDLYKLCDKRIDDAVKQSTEEARMITTYKRLGLLDDEITNAYLRDIWGETQKFSESILAQKLNQVPNLYNMITSGARGSVANLNNICGFIGTVVNLSGEEMPEPIKGNYLCGLTNEEVGTNAFNGRMVKIRTQAGSSTSGETTRKLIYELEHFKIGYNSEEHIHCDTESTCLELKYEPSIDTEEQLFSDEPTADMTPIESDAWIKFIAELERLSLAKCLGDYAGVYLSNMGINYVALKDNPNKVRVHWKLIKEHHNMLWYRTLDTTKVSIPTDVMSACICDNTLGENNYILTHKAIDAIESHHIPKVYFYTMIGCGNDGTICPRCYGYTYEDCAYPEENIQIGYDTAGVIGQKGLQGAQNLHKSGGGKRKVTDIYSGNSKYVFTSPSKLNCKVSAIENLDIYCNKIIADENFPLSSKLQALKNRLDDSINSIDDSDSADNLVESIEGEIYKEISRCCSSVAMNNGYVKCLNYDGILIITVSNDVGDVTWFPLWNQSMQPNVCTGMYVKAGTKLIDLPSINELLAVSLATKVEDAESMNRIVAMEIWYTVLKTMADGFSARNFELTTKAFTEIGMALQPNDEARIVAGRNYPIYKLKKNNVPYCMTIPSDFKLTQDREKVFASLAKEHFIKKVCSFAVHKTISDPLSSTGDMVVGIDRARDKYPKNTINTPIQNQNIEGIVNSFMSNINKNKSLGVADNPVIMDNNDIVINNDPMFVSIEQQNDMLEDGNNVLNSNEPLFVSTEEQMSIVEDRSKKKKKKKNYYDPMEDIKSDFIDVVFNDDDSTAHFEDTNLF